MSRSRACSYFWRARRAESGLSLMPGNFGEVLKPEEFNDLLAFLLSK